MVQIAKKTLVFLCVLIGSQAFPQHEVISDNEEVKDAEGVERERQNVVILKKSVPDVTSPVCRLLNETDCPSTCGNTFWRVIYIMSNGNGSEIIPSFSAFFPVQTECNTTKFVYFSSAVDENGYKATMVEYTGACCLKDVMVYAQDQAGNKGYCPFNIKCAMPTVSPVSTNSPVTSGSSITTISFWSTLILMALQSMLI